MTEAEGTEMVLNLICWFVGRGGGRASAEDSNDEKHPRVLVSAGDCNCCIGGGCSGRGPGGLDCLTKNLL